MMRDTHNSVIFVLGCSLLGVHLALLLHRGVKACRRRRDHLYLGLVRESLSAFLRKARAYLQDREDDPLAPEVERLVTGRRLKLARLMYSCVTWSFILTEAVTVLNIVSGTPRFLSNGLDGLLHAWFLLLTIAKVEPRVINIATLDAWYSVCMFIAVLSTLPFITEKSVLPSLSNTTVSTRLIAGITSLNMPLIICWNTAYFVAITLSYHFGSTDNCPMPLTSTIGAAECFSSVSAILVLFAFKRAMEVQARQEIEARTARKEKSAVVAVLSAMGDAVVKLDRELRIVGNSLQLATMLLQGPRSLSGMQFEQLLAGDEDRQLFREYMAREAPPDQTIADVFHVKVRDTLGNAVQFEVFHVSSKTGDRDEEEPEGHTHLLGLREETGFERDGAGAGAAADLEFPAPEPPIAMPAEDVGAQVQVTIKATSFEVLQYSAGFMALCGQRTPRDVFCEWIAESSRSDFKAHFKSKVESWREAPGPRVLRMHYRNMRLRIPLSGDRTLRMSATCTMSLGTQTDHGDLLGEGQPVAEAVFSDIAVHPRGLQQLRRRRNSDNDDASNPGSASESSVRSNRSARHSQKGPEEREGRVSILGKPANMNERFAHL